LVLYQTAFQRFNLDSSNNAPEIQRSQKLEKAIELLQAFYLLSNLRLLCHVFTYKNFIKYDLKVHFIDSIIEHSQSPTFADIPLIKTYYNVLMFSKNQNNTQNFQFVKTQLENRKLDFFKIDAKKLKVKIFYEQDEVIR